LVFASLYRIAPGVVNENGAETEVNAGLVELINDAFAIRNQFLSGSHDSIEAGPEIVPRSSRAVNPALTPSRLLRLSKDPN
jgi:hypothetical protein